jgi:hypothetical protein
LPAETRLAEGPTFEPWRTSKVEKSLTDLVGMMMLIMIHLILRAKSTVKVNNYRVSTVKQIKSKAKQYTHVGQIRVRYSTTEQMVNKLHFITLNIIKYCNYRFYQINHSIDIKEMIGRHTYVVTYFI